jgi:MinD-like ATPase involved in chromosome partitioning or flagellar assembly
MAWKGWGLDPLLIEADPLGGVLGHRFGVSGARAQRNLRTFAVDTRRVFRGETMAKNLNELAGFDALLGPVDPVQAKQAIEQASPVVAEQLAPSSRPIVADLGRIHHDSVALRMARAADAAYIVLHPRTDQIQAALFQLAALRQQGLRPQLVLVGEKPFQPDEVSAVTDAPVAAVLPFDPMAAVALSGGKFKARSFNRSPLWLRSFRRQIRSRREPSSERR